LPLIDGGYLINPASTFSHIFSPDVVPFENLNHRPCLVLLGEPGIGKSTALEDELAALRPRADVAGEAVHELNLKAYGSEDRLVRALFDNATFRAWLAGSHVLHLVLDSLDECLLRVNTVADRLVEELRRYRAHATRLRFRVACRTAEWPTNLEIGLRELWGQNGVGLYELAPLTRADVMAAATAYTVDPAKFLAEVSRTSAVPLAIKPVTLHFLLKTYRRDFRLPATQNELYQEGCRLLCEEVSPSRRAAGIRGKLTADQRLSIASRVAAVMIFCGRSIIHTGVGETVDPKADVAVRELASGTEGLGGMTYAVTEDGVREVLSTGLFSSRGLERLGWAHQTYAEFLAARYLVIHRMSPTQIRSLILHSEDQEQVIPQLHETTAWLAGMSSAVLDDVMRGDPQVLLRSDVASATDQTRAKIVDTLLRLFAAGQLVDSELNIRLAYKKLRHHGMHVQLEPFIRDRSLDFLVRRLAIDLAEACKIRSLRELLTEVALDGTELHHLRAGRTRCSGDRQRRGSRKIEASRGSTRRR
jgi:predicted NACHT family NTPase